MNKTYIDKLHTLSKSNTPFAIISITETSGSSPAKVGQNIILEENGDFTGTTGGGLIEQSILDFGKTCIINRESSSFSFNLNDIGMSCGGVVSGFVQVQSNENLIIIGGGHIGKMLYNICENLQFNLTIIDDRQEFANEDRFPNAYTTSMPYDEIPKKINLANSYVVIVTRGHSTDLEALKSVINKKPKYIGLIGSKKKIMDIFKTLESQGVDKSLLEKVYGPIGIDVASNDTAEIAISILAEILLVKNNGSLTHKKMYG